MRCDARAIRMHFATNAYVAGPSLHAAIEFDANRYAPRGLEPAIACLVDYKSTLHVATRVDTPSHTLHTTVENRSRHGVKQQMDRVAHFQQLQLVLAKIDRYPRSRSINEGQRRVAGADELSFGQSRNINAINF